MPSANVKTLVYKTIDNVEIPLDVYLPNNAHNVPVLLWFHGGGLLQGSRDALTPHQQRSVEKYGIALVSADYRLAPQVGVAEILEDVRDCITFIRTQLNGQLGAGVIDPSRLAVSGSSAGGYLALLAGLYVNPKPKVIAAIYPITDPLGEFFTTSQQPLPFGKANIDPATVAPFTDVSAPVSINSAASSKRSDMYFYMLKEANLAKLLHVKLGDNTYRVAKQIYSHQLPPTFVVHGDADGAVGVEQADEVVGVLVGIGAEVQYQRLHGIDHIFDRDEKVELEEMYAFIMKHI